MSQALPQRTGYKYIANSDLCQEFSAWVQCDEHFVTSVSETNLMEAHLRPLDLGRARSNTVCCMRPFEIVTLYVA